MTDPNWYEKQIKKFKEVLPIYETYAVTLNDILSKACLLYAPLSIVQARSKTLPSYIGKIVRKDKYNDPTTEITDLCGARVIVQTRDEVDLLCEFIQTHFEIDIRNSVDAGSRLKSNEFGYLSVHYVVSLKDEEILGVPVVTELQGRKAEIQVRTILQHAWADISHDRVYKSPFVVPMTWERISAGLAAVLEMSDSSFNELASSIDEIAAKYGSKLTPEQFDQEIQILTLILCHEEKDFGLSLAALNLTRRLASVNRWGEVIQHLTPCQSLITPLQKQIWTELGHALCERHLLEPQNVEFQNGLALLKKAEDAFKQGGIGANSSSGRAMYASNLASIGDALRYQLDQQAEAHDYYYRAHQIDPGNPYHLMSYLESEIAFRHNVDFVSPQINGIRSAVQTCFKHEQIGIEIPTAYFTKAKLHLLLEEDQPALTALTTAIDVMMAQKVAIAPSRFTDELKRLKSLHGSLMRSIALPDMIRMLEMAISTSDSPSSYGSVSPITAPVLIIMGDHHPLSLNDQTKYYQLLEPALTNFRGTIIFGGLTTGISNVVRKLVHSLSERGKINAKLRAYVPEFLPSKTARDEQKEIEFIEIPCTGFPLTFHFEYLEDICASGIPFDDVRVLCFCQDEVSSIACRFASALEAKVGVVELPDRVIPELLTDPDWRQHFRLLPLPWDRMTLWAFVHTTEKCSWSPAQIEQAAKKVHERYITERQDQGSAQDSSTQSWPFLSDGLKNSNYMQVINASRILEYVGCTLEPTDDTAIKSPVLEPKIINLMAELEHGRWNVERLSGGWRWGETKDEALRTNPSLIPWLKLTPEVRSFDEISADRFTKILMEAGYKVIPPHSPTK